jgi:hypothetical protein
MATVCQPRWEHVELIRRAAHAASQPFIAHGKDSPVSGLNMPTKAGLAQPDSDM